ncbi:MAG: dihydrofolate reductase family protein [Candidatus Woesebacteria bacterium]|nr:MAG: dihydrofolate reductase family protein [Candidatus Woesebacteria bacterium]
MKVILYTATTINGMLATKDNKTPWSEAEFKSFFENVRKAGNVIVGSKTFPLFLDTDFEDMGDPVVVILTREKRVDTDKVKYVDSPQKALSLLSNLGFVTALITGGGLTNGAFLKENLVDEIYLDIEPMIFQEGIPLFNPAPNEIDLKFLDQKMLNENTIQLHYSVTNKPTI